MRHIATLSLILSATVATAAHAADPIADYVCKDGSHVLARFRNGGPNPGVALRFPATGRRLFLPQALSADGGRYVQGEVVFWIKGRQATLTRNDISIVCATKS